jgi:hypothetical protein
MTDFSALMTDIGATFALFIRPHEYTPITAAADPAKAAAAGHLAFPRRPAAALIPRAPDRQYMRPEQIAAPERKLRTVTQALDAPGGARVIERRERGEARLDRVRQVRRAGDRVERLQPVA